MKVLFVCPFVPWPLVDGGKIRTFNLIKEAASHAEIHLRVVREPGQAEDTEEALRPWCGSLRFFERGRLRPLQRVLRPKLERWFHSPALLPAVHADLAAGDFHLVHLDELLLARVVPPDPRVPVIQHHHKLDTILYARLSDGLGPKRHFDLWKLQRLEAELGGVGVVVALRHLDEMRAHQPGQINGHGTVSQGFSRPGASWAGGSRYAGSA